MKLRLLFPTLAFFSVIHVFADDWPGWGGLRRDGVWREKGIVQSFPETGPKILWRTPIHRGYAGPAVADGKVFIMDRQVADPKTVPGNPFARGKMFFSSFYNGSMALKLKPGDAPEILWRTAKASERRTEHLHGIINTAVIADGHIYGACSYGEFRCLELATGKRIWESLEPVGLKRPTRWGTVFVTPHEDRYFLFSETGELAIAKLSPKGYQEISRAKVIEPDGFDMRQRPIVWSHPAYAMKSCFIRNDSEVIRVSLAK